VLICKIEREGAFKDGGFIQDDGASHGHDHGGHDCNGASHGSHDIPSHGGHDHASHGGHDHAGHNHGGHDQGGNASYGGVWPQNGGFDYRGNVDPLPPPTYASEYAPPTAATLPPLFQPPLDLRKKD
jgi:hypothetical protein